MTSSTFRVGLVQMRAGRSPAANLDAVTKLIGEAKDGGAHYVQTPEMTNIMEVSREKLFATIVPEEDDVSLATFREIARKLSIHLHIGSLAVKATVDKATNRGFLIDPHGEIETITNFIENTNTQFRISDQFRIQLCDGHIRLREADLHIANQVSEHRKLIQHPRQQPLIRKAFECISDTKPSWQSMAALHPAKHPRNRAQIGKPGRLRPSRRP